MLRTSLRQTVSIKCLIEDLKYINKFRAEIENSANYILKCFVDYILIEGMYFLRFIVLRYIAEEYLYRLANVIYFSYFNTQ